MIDPPSGWTRVDEWTWEHTNGAVLTITETDAGRYRVALENRTPRHEEYRDLVDAEMAAQRMMGEHGSLLVRVLSAVFDR
jgi:hypothetical protein